MDRCHDMDEWMDTGETTMLQHLQTSTKINYAAVPKTFKSIYAQQTNKADEHKAVKLCRGKDFKAIICHRVQEKMSRMLSITQWGRVTEGDGSRQEASPEAILQPTQLSQSLGEDTWLPV